MARVLDERGKYMDKCICFDGSLYQWKKIANKDIEDDTNHIIS